MENSEGYYVDIFDKELWYVELSISPTDAIGHEQMKKRPCLVIKANPSVKLATIIPLTSQAKTLKFPYTIFIPKTDHNCLEIDSIGLVFQIRSLSFVRFRKFIGEIENEVFEKIKILIRDYFEL